MKKYEVTKITTNVYKQIVEVDADKADTTEVENIACSIENSDKWEFTDMSEKIEIDEIEE